MPEIISDTSPLQYLYQTERLDLLRLLYGEILIPDGVAEEIAEGRSLGYSLPDLSSLGWVRTVGVADRRTLLLASDLGKGEREVLSLAIERPGATAILDDGLARRMAVSLGLTFTGTLGVLLRAKVAGHLKTVRPTIDQLQVLGFRLDPATRAAVLDVAGEG